MDGVPGVAGQGGEGVVAGVELVRGEVVYIEPVVVPGVRLGCEHLCL